MKLKEVLTAEEVAAYFGLDPTTISNMEYRGLISPISNSSDQRLFNREEIERLLECTDILEYKKGASQEEYASRDSDQLDHTPFQNEFAVIFNADFLEMKSIQEESIDLIVTSPPYNVDIEYGSHDDTMTYGDYLSFTGDWLTKSYALLKDEGRLCLNVPLDKNKGGQQSVCADITVLAKKIGFKYHSTIVWNEQNISRRTAWGSWLSASAPYVIAPVEVIIVMFKGNWKRTKTDGHKSDVTRDEFLDWTNGVWTFSGESKKRIGHPAPFPVELPYRCVKLFSFVGDTILDPFLGSGSTLLACLKTGRFGIGVDIDEEYCQLAKNRLLAEGRFAHPSQLEFDLIKANDMARKEGSVRHLVMQYFEAHPHQDIEHGPVVDWVEDQYVALYHKKPRDTWRTIRKLAQEGKLIRVSKGLHPYDPDIVNDLELWDFPESMKKQIFERDNYRCVVCGLGRDDDVEICADHKKPKDKGGDHSLSNGQTLCMKHNLMKKNYSQTEAGKRFFIKLYETAKAEVDERMIFLSEEIFDVYDKYDIDSQIKRPDQP